MEYRTLTKSQKLIKLTTPQGEIFWMLYTEERTLVETRSGDSNEVHSDDLNIRLVTAGASHRDMTPGAEIMSMRGHASGYGSRTVNFSDGYIVVEDPWKGLRIGTYMMNRLVIWAKENYPDYQPVGIRLGVNQAVNAEWRQRRNKFYGRFNFRFNWNGDDQVEGSLCEDQFVKDLRTTDLWKGLIEEFAVEDGLRMIFAEARGAELRAAEADRRADAAVDARIYAEQVVSRARSINIRWGVIGFAIGMILSMIIFG